MSLTYHRLRLPFLGDQELLEVVSNMVDTFSLRLLCFAAKDVVHVRRDVAEELIVDVGVLLSASDKNVKKGLELEATEGFSRKRFAGSE